MSIFEKFTEGWTFRTTTPDFEPGATYRVVITGFDDADGTALARVGDSVLHVEDTGRAHVDAIALVRVTEFDGNEHVGRAELVDVVGETTY